MLFIHFLRNQVDLLSFRGNIMSQNISVPEILRKSMSISCHISNLLCNHYYTWWRLSALKSWFAGIKLISFHLTSELPYTELLMYYMLSLLLKPCIKSQVVNDVFQKVSYRSQALFHFFPKCQTFQSRILCGGSLVNFFMSTKDYVVLVFSPSISSTEGLLFMTQDPTWLSTSLCINDDLL